jgi:hypothetical protein
MVSQSIVVAIAGSTAAHLMGDKREKEREKKKNDNTRNSPQGHAKSTYFLQLTVPPKVSRTSQK